MSPTKQVKPVPPVVNRMWSYLICRGMAPRSMHLLTVCGRKTGKPHTTVVALVAEAGEQFLVAPYGEVNWVQNARAAQHVTLRHGHQMWSARPEELPPNEAAPVLKKYLAEHIVTRPYFEVKPEAPVELFEQEARRHPVFLLHRN